MRIRIENLIEQVTAIFDFNGNQEEITKVESSLNVFRELV